MDVRLPAGGKLTLTRRILRKLGLADGAGPLFVHRKGKLVLLPLGKNYFDTMAGSLGTEGDMLKGLIREKKRERIQKKVS